VKTSLIGCRARYAQSDTATGKFVKDGFPYVIVAVYIEEGVPCFLLGDESGFLHTQLAVNMQIDVQLRMEVPRG
jgi:hypothetical protein